MCAPMRAHEKMTTTRCHHSASAFTARSGVVRSQPCALWPTGVEWLRGEEGKGAKLKIECGNGISFLKLKIECEKWYLVFKTSDKNEMCNQNIKIKERNG